MRYNVLIPANVEGAEGLRALEIVTNDFKTLGVELVTAQSDKPPGEDNGSAQSDHETNRGQVNLSNGGNRSNNSAGSIFGFPGGQTVNFSPMPAVALPRKSTIPTG